MTSTCVAGLLNGITVSNHFNPYYGRDAVAVLVGSSLSLEDDYGYDDYGRLGSVSNGNYSASYGYVPNSDLLQTTTFKNGADIVLTTTRTWDYGMRLRSIANVVGSAPVTSHSYQYDALNRRTQATLEDGSYWSYGYDDRDELIGAHRYWSYFATSKPVSGQQFGYAYDNIGNRQTASFGGDTNGLNLRTNTYANNSLNQYTGILTPGYENIIGAALATNGVTVNNGTADRKGEYFHREITVANGSSPVWQNVTNISGTFTNKGGLLVPASSQVLTYDADGNLSSDSIWTYQWDGENRLISMTMTNNVAWIADTNRLKLDFAYDCMGRRIQKIVSVWNSSTLNYQPSTTNRFIYDGWNLLAIINPQSSILQSFMWGQDLSGTMTRAGGVGGLLMATISGTNCFAAYDGNGNITSLINATDKSLAARYEYSPYGELLRATGPMARQNAFRLSTKFWDDESGSVCYGFRCYCPTLGRWISRDSLEEQGGLNLYVAFLNSPINLIDSDGRSIIKSQVAAIISAAAQYLFALQNGALPSQPTQQWLRQTAQEARAVSDAASREFGALSDGGSGGSGGFGKPPSGYVFFPELRFNALLGLADVMASSSSVLAAAHLALGYRSERGSATYLIESSMLNTIHGEEAYADLDAIGAGLQMTGYQCDYALEATSVIMDADQAFDAGY